MTIGWHPAGIARFGALPGARLASMEGAHFSPLHGARFDTLEVRASARW